MSVKLLYIRNKSIYPGHITEISLGGMALQYHSRNGKTPEAWEADIISANYTEAVLISRGRWPKGSQIDQVKKLLVSYEAPSN